MTKTPTTPFDAFRQILDLEHRSQKFEELVQHLKQVYLQPADHGAPPDSSSLLTELRHAARKVAQAIRAVEAVSNLSETPAAGHAPAHPTAPNQALRGSTRSIPMPDLIALLSSQRKTGTLYIKAEDERFVLELLEGAVVHIVCDSPRKDQRLGDILISQNKISADELQRFLSQYCRGDGRMGEILARTQVISDADLVDALEYQARELFRLLFSIDEALFSFTCGKVSDLQHRVSLNTTQLLLDSARRQDEDVRDGIAAALGGILEDTPRSDAAGDPTNTDQQTAELHAVDGITLRTAQELVKRNIRSLDDLARTTDHDLLAVPGIGEQTLRLIRAHRPPPSAPRT